jgi:hypothetical protein
MTRHLCDPGTEDFEHADRWITRLRRQFKDENLCVGCVARALLLHGAHSLSRIIGFESAAVSLVELAAVMHEIPTSACDRDTRH